MKEIGSEFYLNSDLSFKYEGIPEWLKLGQDNKFVFSGRTAIDYVLKDFVTNENEMVVYFPSYCCTSMLQPFTDMNLKIEFYDVNYTKGEIMYEIDLNKKCDVFFAMNYFGFSSTNMDYYINEFSDKNIIVIEDITHSLLSKRPCSKKSDYLIASLRKWFAIPTGGLAVKVEGEFKNNNLIEPESLVIENKIEAMNEKYNYINKSIINKKLEVNKNIFLKKYVEFNHAVSNKYKNISIDKLSLKILSSLDIKKIIERRKENIKYLNESIKNVQYLELLVKDINIEDDCLLFLPVIIHEEKRSYVRQKLINNNVYLPVHWPVPSEVKNQHSVSNIYSRELSIVCDQRYNLEDMRRIVEIFGGC